MLDKTTKYAIVIMMKHVNILLVLLVVSVLAVTSFPQSVAKESTTTVGFNSTPIKDNKDFVQRIFKCVEGLYSKHERYPLERQVPFDLIVAMAAYESAWGQSRFAKQGNNFFTGSGRRIAFISSVV